MFTKKFWQNNKEIIKFTLLAFIFWQFFIALFIFLGEKYVPLSPQFAYKESEPIVNPMLLWNRANFDGIHYLDIARKGYGIYQQAFFPLYPKLINLLTPFFGGKDLLVTLLISWLTHFLALVFLYRLVLLDFDKSIAKRTIFFLLGFPTAFFFSMVYSESLFLFLILSSFYFARTKKWWLAGIFGAFASATRLVGIFLFPALLIEWWEQREIRNWKARSARFLRNVKIGNLLALLLIPLGLLYYMRFLSIHYHDPLMFLHVQPFFGAGRSADKLILLYQVFWRYLKMLWTVQKWSLTYFVVVLEFLTGTGFLTLLLLSYLKKIRLSYIIFAALAYIAPTLTGTFLSLPRFVLVCFPCFMVIALIENRIFRFALFAFNFSLLMVCTILFTRGYWIG